MATTDKNVVGTALDGLIGKADNAVLAPIKDVITPIKTFLEGEAPRAPIDFGKAIATFRPGENLSTPDGDDPRVPARPNYPKTESLLSASMDLGKRIKLIHYGRVHRDAASNWACAQPLDDLDATLDLSKVIGGRAVAYRAALEREAILLGTFGVAAMQALVDRDSKEGSTRGLLGAAADLVGGAATKKKDLATSADLSPFFTKLTSIWTSIDKDEIRYTDIHKAGVDLHVLRANLFQYLFEQIDTDKSPPAPNTPGLLSNLPIVGPIAIPPPLGDAVGFMQKITDKIFDVQIQLSFALLIAMRSPIESACNDLAIDAIRARRPPLYRTWFQPPPRDAGQGGDKTLAAMTNPLQGNLLGPAAAAAGDAIGVVNAGINKAANEDLVAGMDAKDLVEFLSTPVRPAPGSRYLADAFQASLGAGKGLPILKGSEALADLAVSAVCTSVAGKVPDVMTGIAGDVARHVFRVAVEFIRGVYTVLCSYPTTLLDDAATDALLAAGRRHVLGQLLDCATDGLGLDRLLDQDAFKLEIPPLPYTPAGIDWPARKKLGLAPILGKLKSLLAEKAEPLLAPIVDFATADMAQRLASSRAWACDASVTMEVHLGMLPVEIALFFRHLFGPLWGFVTDVLMDALNDAADALLGGALAGRDFARDAVGKVDGLIAGAERRAKEARDYAAKAEDKAKALLGEFKSANLPGILDGSKQNAIEQGVTDLKKHVTGGIFTQDGPTPQPFVPPTVSLFDPKSRKSKGKGKEIERDELDKASAEDRANGVDAALASGVGSAGDSR